jgi:hypothetical protein
LHFASALALARIDIDPTRLLFDNVSDVVFEFLPTCEVWRMPRGAGYDKQEIAISIFPRAGVGHGKGLGVGLSESDCR